MASTKPGLDIKRHDNSADKSLRPHSAVDEYLLKIFNELSSKPKNIAIYHDRFGFLSCHLSELQPTIILSNNSQEKAIQLNLKANKLPVANFVNPLSSLDPSVDFALIKAPKSLGLFQAFLEQVAQNSTNDVVVIVGFMTRHFTPRLLEISKKYFEDVKQSKAIKKSRVLTLTKKKQVAKLDIIDVLKYKEDSYQQYWGVFSSKHIDYATQYFLEHLALKQDDKHILDLASGNGIIAKVISRELPSAEIHLLDDSFLAVESGKLNLHGDNIHHHYSSDLSEFENETFDLIVSNPPFHFEYEVNIQIAIQLFNECFRCLKTNGNLQIVASKHLNYKTHLKPIFSSVEVSAQNEKFIIYRCFKLSSK